MPRTLEEVDQALATVESYMGDTPTYEGYGNTLAEALTRYSNPLYNDVSITDNLVEVNFLGNKDAPIPEVMFTVLIKTNCTGESVIRLHRDGTYKDYPIKIYDGDTNTFRVLVAGDYTKGYMYTFYYTNGFFVIAGMNESAIVNQLNELNVWQDATGDYLKRIGTDIVIAPDGSDNPTEGLKATILEATNSFASPKLNVNATTVEISGALDISKVTSVIPKNIVDDEDLITKLYYDETTEKLVYDVFNKIFIVDTMTPVEYEDANGPLPNGTIYFELA